MDKYRIHPEGAEALAANQIQEVDDTRFRAYVVRRLTETEIDLWAAQANGMMASSEVLIDLLLGSVPPEASDNLLADIDSDIARGDRTAQHEKQLLDHWTACKMTGRMTSIANVADEDEIDDLLIASKELVGALMLLAFTSNPRRITIVHEVLSEQVDKQNQLALGCQVLMDVAFKELQGAARSMVNTPHGQDPFNPDGRADELEALLKRFFVDLSPPNATLRHSADPCPSNWEDDIRTAVQLQRRGEFYESAKIYVDLVRRSGVAHGDLLASLYKTVASAGLLSSAWTLLIAHVKGVDVQDHAYRLRAASRSRLDLENYLRDISGNVNYRFPRDYTTMVDELDQHLNSLAKMMEDVQKVQRQSSGACYIATAVYGSYGAPEVLILRRFRDESLAKSAVGRGFIRTYYRLSPALATRFKHGSIPNRVGRRILDAMVRTLENKEASRMYSEVYQDGARDTAMYESYEQQQS